MKTTNWILALMAVIGFATSPIASASMLKACKKDLKTLGCKAKTEAEVQECLEKNEAHGKKDDGFSHGCYEAHEAYEKKAGKEEAGE